MLEGIISAVPTDDPRRFWLSAAVEEHRRGMQLDQHARRLNRARLASDVLSREVLEAEFAARTALPQKFGVQAGGEQVRLREQLGPAGALGVGNRTYPDAIPAVLIVTLDPTLKKQARGGVQLKIKLTDAAGNRTKNSAALGGGGGKSKKKG